MRGFLRTAIAIQPRLAPVARARASAAYGSAHRPCPALRPGPPPLRAAASDIAMAATLMDADAPILFSLTHLDRASNLREDAAFQSAARRDPAARAVLTWRGAGCVHAGTAAAYLPLPAALALAGSGPTDSGGGVPGRVPDLASHALSFLGLQRPPPIVGTTTVFGRGATAGRPLFAIDVTTAGRWGTAPPSTEDLAACGAPGCAFLDLRKTGPAFTLASDAAILALAAGLSAWHRASSHCGVCGGAVVTAGAGWRRCCPKCSASVPAAPAPAATANTAAAAAAAPASAPPGERGSSYVRVDPAIIALVASPDGTHALLGRNAKWPPGRYSCLAGFAEVGETLEEAVCREVHEESDVKVNLSTVSYVASQPWPFPSSLMVGFTATAIVGGGSGDDEAGVAYGTRGGGGTGLPRAAIDGKEMSDVRWFSKDFLRRALEDGAAGGGFARPATPPPPEGVATGPPSFHLPGPMSLAYRLIHRFCQSP